jgi:hypothetical protein
LGGAALPALRKRMEIVTASAAEVRVGRTLPSASSGQALSDALDLDLDFAHSLYQLQNLQMQRRLQFQFGARPLSQRCIPSKKYAREGHDFSRAVLVCEQSGFQPLRCALEAYSGPQSSRNVFRNFFDLAAPKAFHC